MPAPDALLALSAWFITVPPEGVYVVLLAGLAQVTTSANTEKLIIWPELLLVSAVVADTVDKYVPAVAIDPDTTLPTRFTPGGKLLAEYVIVLPIEPVADSV
jgi:hypothetical protein